MYVKIIMNQKISNKKKHEILFRLTIIGFIVNKISTQTYIKSLPKSYKTIISSYLINH